MPHDTCLYCGRPRKRVVRNQKRASAFRVQYRAPAPAVMLIKCVEPRTRHKFSKDTK